MENQTTLKQVLLQEATSTYATTERLFHRVDDGELTWKPGTGNNWMTMAQLLMHCACFGCGKGVQGFTRGDWGMPEGEEANQDLPPAEALPGVKSVGEALALLASDRALALKCIEEAREEGLLTETVAAPWGGPELTLFQQVHFMIEHLSQHKGQLFYYLKLMGKPVGTADLWGA